MKYFFIIFSVFLFFSNAVRAQEEDFGELILPQQTEGYKLKLQRYRYKKPEIEEGDTIWCYTWNPGLWVYAPIKFKSERQRRAYNKLIYNVKKVLPIAQRVNSIITESYEVLEMLPDKKSKQQHIANIEKDLMRQYKPEMKKLTYSQGKLLIKLIDRECNQSSYEIVKAFFGPAKATFYQIFAWTFRASLKKEYKPEDDDKLIERVVLLVENGQL
ncbi:MAG: DUF4294 domain-containing protein [Bacteroidaceae bacterium]|nr:DUF4294 domain-containing protein [Bacteroidaceae bacterium]